MRTYNKSLLAMALITAIGMAGCSGDDGTDGEDGAPGTPGEPGTPTLPVTGVSEVTNVEYITHLVEEGLVTVEFSLTDEDGTAIIGLENASIYLAAMTDSGIQRSRDGSVGGKATAGGDEPTEGASITEVDDGQYTFVAPMAAVQADTEGLIRLQVGGGDIASSPYIIIDKPEMTHTSTTETCYSCHVDYATSDIKHSKYVALNTAGEVDFVGGCMVCHNNIARGQDETGEYDETGGYAKNTMQKLGHINHQKFEKDFTPTNCYSCHAEPVINTSIAGNGCSDCHTSDASAAAIVQATGDFDAREFHAKSTLIGIDERDVIRANHYTTTGTPYFNPTMDEWIDHKDVAWTSGYCVDIALFDNSGETPVQLNIGEMYAAHEVTYGGAYINNYHNDSIVARVISHGTEGYIEQADGSRSVCYGVLTEGYELANLSASSRITIADTNWEDSDGEFGVSFTNYSDVVDPINFEKVQDWGRRHDVAGDTCTTCHNNDTNYHKNGGYRDGGLDCVACHNNGQDRRAAYSAPGFGPMVHSMHWGIGNALSGAKVDEETGENLVNSAASLNADNCVSCHADGVSLADVPNQYMLSKAYNEGNAGVMTSPITANCFACHNSDQALNHMGQNGGELNVPTTVGWFTEGTSESCATCHDTGKSFGIDKFHNFDRTL
ncbi:hypothetical protein FM038_005015 [Shewanella eurypsychrophilus]|uniref:Outer membrane cytochrome MtrC/MtrF-like domain-containing protein n=2 Tax=Shewanella TaxID=22 RepID=A0ABX6VF20_9GAMM|nr:MULTISPECIES: cytochrome c3 family protein [Shewanella]QFU25199.1 hypothetical protein FS418_06595 [Shewanella sp. YLB-09]QPG60349.1 hypothetical protein FM038_005015 [Shewanella eurypsychrophilus]